MVMRLEASVILHVFYILEVVYSQDVKFATDCLTPNNVHGLCVEIRHCKKLMQLVIDNRSEAFEFLRASRCDPHNEEHNSPKVCCGPDTNFIRPEPDVKDDTTSITTLPPPAGHLILPKKCGKQKVFVENKIFGGKEAAVGEFPWLARLVHYNQYNRTGLGCSGFLIHRRFILTAAHCLVGKGIDYLGPLNHVILGVHNDTRARICTDTGMCTDAPRIVYTMKAVIHEMYDSNTHSHDIALIPLKEKVSFTDFIKAICLSPSTTNASSFVISGWGRTETDTSSRTKLKVDIPKADRMSCAEKYRALGLQISERQICAGGELGHDSCSGDSGGPLMAIGDQDLWYAEGIVSFGNSCGREGWPGVYTYIPKYYDWIIHRIKDVMKENGMVR